VAAAHGEAATPAELMRAADRALYQAKRTRDAVALAGEPPAAIPAPRAEGSGVRA
jgi:GGDEF domain-containing protein